MSDFSSVQKNHRVAGKIERKKLITAKNSSLCNADHTSNTDDSIDFQNILHPNKLKSDEQYGYKFTNEKDLISSPDRRVIPLNSQNQNSNFIKKPTNYTSSISNMQPIHHNLMGISINLSWNFKLYLEKDLSATNHHLEYYNNDQKNLTPIYETFGTKQTNNISNLNKYKIDKHQALVQDTFRMESNIF